jgi:hypothetical protein
MIMTLGSYHPPRVLQKGATRRLQATLREVLSLKKSSFPFRVPTRGPDPSLKEARRVKRLKMTPAASDRITFRLLIFVLTRQRSIVVRSKCYLFVFFVPYDAYCHSGVSIGSGLLYQSGQYLSLGGPGSLLLAYIFMGSVLYSVMVHSKLVKY